MPFDIVTVEGSEVFLARLLSGVTLVMLLPAAAAAGACRLATTPNGELAGIARTAANNAQVTIGVAPTASATGRLLDAESGAPLGNRQIDYYISTDPRGHSVVAKFRSSVTTDDNGAFTLTRLVVGGRYFVRVVLAKDANGFPRSMKELTTFQLKKAKPLQLGNLKLRTEP